MSYSLFHEHNECVHPKEKKVELGYVLPTGCDFEQSYEGMHYCCDEEQTLYPFIVTSFVENGIHSVVLSTVTDIPEDSVITVFSSSDFHYGGAFPKFLRVLPNSIFDMCEYINFAYPAHSKLLRESILSDYALSYYVKGSETNDGMDNAETVFKIYEKQLAEKVRGKS